MKNINFVLTFALMISCSSNNKCENDIDQIIGTWTINTIFGFNCDSCPKVTFSELGNGIIYNINNEKQEFQYSFSSDCELIIRTNESLFISRGNYPLIFRDANSINLLTTDGKLFYTLSRD